LLATATTPNGHNSLVNIKFSGKHTRIQNSRHQGIASDIARVFGLEIEKMLIEETGNNGFFVDMDGGTVNHLTIKQANNTGLWLSSGNKGSNKFGTVEIYNQSRRTRAFLASVAITGTSPNMVLTATCLPGQTPPASGGFVIMGVTCSTTQTLVNADTQHTRAYNINGQYTVGTRTGTGVAGDPYVITVSGLSTVQPELGPHSPTRSISAIGTDDTCCYSPEQACPVAYIADSDGGGEDGVNVDASLTQNTQIEIGELVFGSKAFTGDQVFDGDTTSLQYVSVGKVRDLVAQSIGSASSALASTRWTAPFAKNGFTGATADFTDSNVTINAWRFTRGVGGYPTYVRSAITAPRTDTTDTADNIIKHLALTQNAYYEWHIRNNSKHALKIVGGTNVNSAGTITVVPPLTEVHCSLIASSATAITITPFYWEQISSIETGYTPLVQQTTITSAQLLALNATPITVVTAPGANLVAVPDEVVLYYPYTQTTIGGSAASAAYAGIAATEDFALRYQNTTGLITHTCEAVGFIDQTSAKSRRMTPVGTGATVEILSAGGHAKVGTTAGWVVAGANNSALVTLPASQTGSTLVVPLPQLKLNQKFSSISLIGQVESGGNNVTIDCNLRKMTAAAADVTDASVASMTQLVVATDTILSATNTTIANMTESMDADDTFYLLITATTTSATDIALQGIVLTYIPVQPDLLDSGIANQPLVLHMQTGEVITGNSVLGVRVYYHIVPAVLTQ
jgi:hypothetical protein